MMPKSSSTSDSQNPQPADMENNKDKSSLTAKTTSKDNSKKPLKSSVPVSSINNEGVGGTIADILDSDYRGVSLYTVAMLLLIIAILWTGLRTVQQIQSYHQLYGQMTKLKKDFRQLQIERQRMLIEQQTFSGTPQVTNRAVAELNMFYPNLSDRMIIHANNVVTHPTAIAVSSTVAPTTSQSTAENPSIDPRTQH